MSSQAASELAVDARRLTIRKLDRVVFPRAGVTKGALLDYYVRVGDTMLAHLRERQLHMHRYPEGVEGPRFWQKGCPEHRPEWLPTAPVWSRDKRANIDFCVVNELATLLWAVNTLLQCCEVALRLRELFTGVGLRSYPKTSGSKGLQVYVPLNSEDAYATTKPATRATAELLEAETPDSVVSRMAKALRAGKVLVDWSQNTEHKSMVCAYSMRAKQRPTVSTPLAWEEIGRAVDLGDSGSLVFEMGDVLERVTEHGDLFAPVLTTRQRLSAPAAQPPTAS